MPRGEKTGLHDELKTPKGKQNLLAGDVGVCCIAVSAR